MFGKFCQITSSELSFGLFYTFGTTVRPPRRSGASLYSLRLPRGEASWLPPRSAWATTAECSARRRSAAEHAAPPSNQYSARLLLVLARGCCEWHARAHCSLRTMVITPWNHSGFVYEIILLKLQWPGPNPSVIIMAEMSRPGLRRPIDKCLKSSKLCQIRLVLFLPAEKFCS